MIRRRRRQPEPEPDKPKHLSGMLKAKPGNATKHGAYSASVRQRYSDLRSKEGRKLEAVTKGLVEDLGGTENVSTAQMVLIENIRSKLIVLFQISEYADEQLTIIDKETGALLPCLGRNFTAYSEALRRDLEALQKLGNNRVPGDLYEKWRKEFFKDAEAKEK